jgi:hypothetical protein
VGDHRSIEGGLVETGRYDNSLPLITTSGMGEVSGGYAYCSWTTKVGNRINFYIENFYVKVS